MITEKDLDEAIAECKGERNPNANTCIKLASYYTIKNELYGKEPQQPGERPERGYSYAAAEQPQNTIYYPGGTEFAEAIQGKSIDEILPAIEELAETVKVLLPRVYAAFLRRI